MACGYDTQTVLEMLSDMDTDNGINSDSIYDDLNRIVVVVAQLRVHFSIYTLGPLSVKRSLLIST